MGRKAEQNGRWPGRIGTLERIPIGGAKERTAGGSPGTGTAEQIPVGPWSPHRPRVVVAIRDIGLHQEVLDSLARDPRIDLAGATADPQRVGSVLAQSPVDAVILCPDQLAGLHPSARGGSVVRVMVASEMTVPVLREAIDGGATAVFAWPDERPELLDTISRIPVEESVEPSSRGRVIAVCGARGGTGTTFVATHLAAAFAQLGRRTVIVDADSHCGDVTVALGYRPEDVRRSIADLLPVAMELSPDHVEDALCGHRRGFSSLLAPPSPSPSPIPPGIFAGSVALLAGSHEFVVVHLPRAFDDAARRLAGLADQVLLVTSLDLFSLYGAKRAIAALGLQDPARCGVVVNRVCRPQLKPRDVARVLGLRPTALIRLDPGVRRAQSRGELLPARSRRAGQDVRELAKLLSRVATSGPDRPGA